MDAVCSIKAMRDMEAHMINDVGVPGVALMENAASALAEAVNSVVVKMPVINVKIVILCGAGNNGGDGFALLRKLAVMPNKNRIKACAVLVSDAGKIGGDALVNYRAAINAGLDVSNDIERLRDADIIVDAIFGTGLARPIEGLAKRAVLIANSQKAVRIAVDIPSGMNGDTGAVTGCVFNADITVTFHAIKRGLILTKHKEAVGEIRVAPIGVMQAKVYDKMNDELLLDEGYVRGLLPIRPAAAHKGSFGKALIVAGSEGMAGAAVMATRSALRAGAGLTKALIPKQIEYAFAAAPEAMLIFDDSVEDGANWASSIGIGCGMGVSERTAMLLEKMLATGKPVIIDADALNTMAQYGNLKGLLHGNAIITPHPAEMARLLACQTGDILNDPVGAAASFAKEHGCTALLKSATSVIAAPNGVIRYNTKGSNALAKGGSGDVLTGIITGLAAGGASPFDAACIGAYILGCSAEEAFRLLEKRMVTAGDVTEALTAALDR